MSKNQSCERAKMLFDDSIDKMLNESESAFLEEHLKQCETCRTEYEQYKQTVNAIRDTAPDIPADLHASILKKLEPKQPKRSTVILRRIRAVSGVCVAALLCVAVLTAPFLHHANPKNATAYEIGCNKEDNEKFYSADASNSEETMKMNPYESGMGTDGTILWIFYEIAGTDLVIVPTDRQNASVFRKNHDGTQQFLRSVTYTRSQDRFEIQTPDARAVLSVKENMLTLTEGDLSEFLTADN